jgi:hypothetical protein
MDSLKFHPGSPCSTLLPKGGSPLKWPYDRFRDGPPAGRQGERPAAVVHPFGHPTPSSYGGHNGRLQDRLGLELRVGLVAATFSGATKFHIGI